MATIDNKELKVGDVVKAYVASIKDFGASSILTDAVALCTTLRSFQR